MKAREIKELSTEELQRRVTELREELFRLRFQIVSKQLGNPHRIGQVRRDIARVLTVLQEKHSSSEVEGGKK